MICERRIVKATELGDVLPGEVGGAAVLGVVWSEEGWGVTYPFAMLSCLAGSVRKKSRYRNTVFRSLD